MQQYEILPHNIKERIPIWADKLSEQLGITQEEAIEHALVMTLIRLELQKTQVTYYEPMED